jgi:hypothetical protein
VSNEQLFFAILSVLAAQTGIILTVVLLYINAKIDPLRGQVTLLQYVVTHEGKIAVLEERTKGAA